MPCESGQYTKGGECCEVCPPGEGVVRRCGANQTVCAQCLDSEFILQMYKYTSIQTYCIMHMHTGTHTQLFSVAQLEVFFWIKKGLRWVGMAGGVAMCVAEL